MPNNLIEQLKKAKQTVHLSAERKAAVRDHLLEMMDGPARAKHALRRTSAQPAGMFGHFSSRFRVMSAVVAAVVLASSGVSFAAQDAQPGDVLYPVKVSVNEEVRAAFAFSPSAKTEVAIKRAEARLAEASSLSSEGKLDADTETELQVRFEEQADAVARHLTELDDDNEGVHASTLAVRFEGTLRAQQAVLASLEHDKEGKGELNDALRGRIRVFAALREHVQAHIDDEGQGTDPAEVAARVQIQEALKVVTDTRGHISENDDEELSRAADVRAKAAERFAAEAEAKLKDGRYSEAFVLGNNALGAAAEARSFSATRSRGHLNRNTIITTTTVDVSADGSDQPDDKEDKNDDKDKDADNRGDQTSLNVLGL